MAPRDVSPSNRIVTMLAFLVMVLLAAGMITLQVRAIMEPPANPSQEEWQNYQRALRQISFIGAVLLDAGVGLLLMTSILVAVRRNDVAEAVRRGILILATVVTALWLFAAFFVAGLGIP